MKKISIISGCIIALAAFAVWAPNADAYSSIRDCRGCHYFSSSNAAHQTHRAIVNGATCSACHNNSNTSTCGACHVVPGIAEFHETSGMACVGCHSAPDPNDVDNDGDNWTENDGDCDDTNAAVNPVAAENCNDGIDNDCNRLTDMDDPDCAPTPICGDGAVDVGEQCDTSGASAACDADCTFPSCGDNTINTAAGEQCDDGNNNDSDGCQADCMLPICGDGILDKGEECDTGAASATCMANCTIPPFCGDGIIDRALGEACDDGNNNNGDGCQADCALPVCGDGILDPDEDCDTAGESATCTANCTISSCGDDTVNTAAGEQCDDGNNNNGDGCQADCALPVCGDGILDPDEDCDTAGESATCTSNCTIVIVPDPVCGDGIVNQDSEECDDGNDINGDDCENDCTLSPAAPFCGDGAVNQPNEQCDDGGASATCTANCFIVVVPDPVCGDGTQDQDEQCDDGNTVNNDGCSENCMIEPFCGNGIQETGEQCDDGRASATCTVACTIVVVPDPVCGDGTKDRDEQCDDGNTTNNDGCSADCTIETSEEVPPPVGDNDDEVNDDDRDEHDDSDSDDRYEHDDDDDDDRDDRFRRTFRRIRERLRSSDYFTRLFSRWN